LNIDDSEITQLRQARHELFLRHAKTEAERANKVYSGSLLHDTDTNNAPLEIAAALADSAVDILNKIKAKMHRGLVGLAQLLIAVLHRLAYASQNKVVRTHGVDDVRGVQPAVVAWSCQHRAPGDDAIHVRALQDRQRTAIGGELWTARSRDGAVDAAAAKPTTVGGVDDGNRGRRPLGAAAKVKH
jgi:hypothetical protein